MGIKRKLAIAAATAASSYVLALGAAVVNQRRILYRQPTKIFGETAIQIILEAEGDEPSMKGWILNPSQEKALIYYGGSAESVEERIKKLTEFFPDFTIYLMPYRGFGPNSAYRSLEAKIKSDAIRLYHHVKTKHQELHVIGRSLGTGVAIHVAARHSVDTLSLITPYDSILDVAQRRSYTKIIPQFSKLFVDKFESWRDAVKLNLPVNAVLAEIDYVTPHERWYSLKKHIHTDVYENVITKTNHTNIVDKDATWQNIQKFIAEHPERSASRLKSPPLETVNGWTEVKSEK